MITLNGSLYLFFTAISRERSLRTSEQTQFRSAFIYLYMNLTSDDSAVFVERSLSATTDSITPVGANY